MLAHKLTGTAAPAVVVQLDAGQTAWCEAGRLVWKTANVAVRTRLSGPVGGPVPGSLAKAVATAVDVGRRRLAGERTTYHHLTAEGGSGLAAFAPPVPGELRELRLDRGRGWLVARGALVVAEATVGPDPTIATGPGGEDGDGGERPELAGLAGTGSLFLAAAGSFLEVNPARYGGAVQVDAARLIAVQEGVGAALDRTAGPAGLELVMGLLGGAPAGLATLSGDGLVLVQSAGPAGPAAERPVAGWPGGKPG